MQETTFFKSKARTDFFRAKSNLRLQLGNLFTPYASLKYHASSTLYPVTDSILAIENLAMIGIGLTDVMADMLDGEFLGPLKNFVLAAVYEVGAAVFHVVSALVSLVSFFTRTLATVGNLGYSDAELSSNDKYLFNNNFTLKLPSQELSVFKRL